MKSKYGFKPGDIIQIKAFGHMSGMKARLIRIQKVNNPDLIVNAEHMNAALWNIILENGTLIEELSEGFFIKIKSCIKDPRPPWF